MQNRKAETEMYLYDYLKNNKQFSKDWDTKKLKQNPNDYIQSVLDKSSKQKTEQRGEPDLIYCNEVKKLLILVENKDSINDHVSKDNKNSPVKYAVDGIKHYLSFFLEENLSNENKHLRDWRILGIAFSGDIEDKYNKKIDTFYIKNNSIENADIQEFLNENDYIALFENIDIEKITNEISTSSQKINNQLRSIDSHNRPILLSALMISLLDRQNNDFRNNYVNYNADTIADNIPNTVEKILKKEGIKDSAKINVLKTQLSFLKHDIDLRDNNKKILQSILNELKDKVIPLFDKKTNYDIIGKFYEEFLKYAGMANVKKGIVLTPHHITTLFTELIDLKYNDVIMDACCGTGGFLIAGMNKILDVIDNSTLADKEDQKNKVKEGQLLGFEKNSTMFSLAISNMLFRKDGKSKVFNEDFFSDNAMKIIKEMNPTIGFINPPYSGLDNSKNPTKKEIQFLERMLDNVSRYGIIIAPLSTYFKDTDIRNRILTKHTLKYVVNMPNDLFQPNAMTHTAVAVFETHNPHNDKEVIFYTLKEDGYVLSKNKGRTDRLNKWTTIKKDLLYNIQNIDTMQDNISMLKTPIQKDDEWLIQAHSKTDYSTLSYVDFENTIKNYVIFQTKKDLGLLNVDMDEISLLEILNSNNISANSILEESFNEKQTNR